MAGSGILDTLERDNDILNSVGKQVSWASSCVPVWCAPDKDTRLLFTYCHKLCDESFRDPMILKGVVVEEGSATTFQIRLPYNHSETVSLKALLKKEEVRGACFAWTEKEGDSGGFRIKHQRLGPIFYAFYVSS